MSQPVTGSHKAHSCRSPGTATRYLAKRWLGWVTGPRTAPVLPGLLSDAENLLFLPTPSASIIRASFTDRTVRAPGVGVEEHLTTLGVQVAVGSDGSAEELAKAAAQLRRELL